MTRRRFLGTAALLFVAPAAAIAAARPPRARSRFDPRLGPSLVILWEGDSLYFADAVHPDPRRLPIAFLCPENPR